MEIITGKITNNREKSKLDELPTAQSTKPIYIRPQSAAPLATSLYVTSSSAIGNNGRPMSATLRKQMREFSYGVSDKIFTWNLSEKLLLAKPRIFRSKNASRHVAKSISERMSHTFYSCLHRLLLLILSTPTS